jgi:UDP-2,3-diacylglucosamine pyrophosphatase LpxH
MFCVSARECTNIMSQLKVILLSDIHLEFYHTLKKCLTSTGLCRLDPGDVDTCVLAGDVGYPVNSLGKPNQLYIQLLTWFKSKFKHVIYVSGNHEYYPISSKKFRHRDTSDETLSIYSADRIDTVIANICQNIGVIFLQKNHWDHPSGFRFIGVTLWSKIDADTSYKMNDPFSYQEVNFMHSDHVRYIISHVASTDNIPTIVVSHHLPSIKCIKPSRLMDGYLSAYYTDLHHVFKSPIVTWFCGHTHDKTETTVNEIPIHINPVGYFHEIIKVAPTIGNVITITGFKPVQTPVGNDGHVGT